MYGEKRCDEDPMTINDLMAENVCACEQLQAAMKAPIFEVGITAKNLESGIITFQELIQEKISE